MSKTISQIMTRSPWTLPPHAPLLDAMTLMRDHRVRHVPVVDPVGRVVGVVSDRDIKRATPSAILADQHAVWNEVVTRTTVSKIMTRDPATVTPATSVKETARHFVEDRLGCMPVVEHERLVGIVTAHDLLKALLDLLNASDA